MDKSSNFIVHLPSYQLQINFLLLVVIHFVFFFLSMLLILLVSHFILELVCGKYIVWNEGTPFPVKGDGNRISKTFIWCSASSGPRESCSRLGSWWYCDWQGMNPCVTFLVCPGNWSMWGGARRDLDHSHMDLIR